MAEERRPGIRAVNMTNFFNRELFMYSLGDIQFKKPVSLKKVAYITGFFIVWTIPLIIIMGIQLNPFFAAAAIAPPIVLGNLCVKPAFGGKNLIDFVKTMAIYIPESRGGWTDLNRNANMGKDTYKIEHEIWIGRRRELQLLADLKEKEEQQRKLATPAKTKRFGRGK